MPFSLQQANQHGLTFYEIKKLVEQGTLEQLARGIYRTPQADYSEEDQFRSACLRIGEPSSVCLLSALSFYHLTDLIPKQTWLLVPNERRTTQRDIKLFRIRDPQWSVGLDAQKGYRITSIERTIVDSLVYKRFLGTQTGIIALKSALAEKQTNLSKVFDMAKSLHVEHRIIPYIEVLS
jgi:predicted transcriptional regulator of viral defense system